MRRLLSSVLLLLLCFSARAIAAPPKAEEIVSIISMALDRPLEAGKVSVLSLEAQIEPGWHINADKPLSPYYIPTRVNLQPPAGIRVGGIRYPTPELIETTFAKGEKLAVFTGLLRVPISLTAANDFKTGSLPATISIDYQACNEIQCLQPVTISKQVNLSMVAAFRPPGHDGKVAQASVTAAEIAESDFFKRHGYPLGYVMVLLAGLALNLTPCVYPLIGVTIAYFGQQSDGSTAKTTVLASLYVAGIAMTFAAVGVTAALSGGLFGAAMANPVVLIVIAGLMLTLAASSFGLLTLQAPSWLMQKAGIARPGYLGSVGMGLGMGVVAAPCIGPVVLGLLLLVEQSQNPIFGFSVLFILAVGMGLPYIALAVMAGRIRSLPRSGDWLGWIEQLFGFALIGLALYFLDPLFPNRLLTRLLPFYAVAVGVYLGFISPAGRTWRPFQIFKLGLGVVSLAALVFLLIPRGPKEQLKFRPFNEAQLANAISARRPVLIDFTADWCLPCREMEGTTYVDPAVVKESSRFVVMRADLTRLNDANTSLISKFEVQGVPTLMLFDSDGKVRKRLVGFIGSDELLKSMKDVS